MKLRVPLLKYTASVMLMVGDDTNADCAFTVQAGTMSGPSGPSTELRDVCCESLPSCPHTCINGEAVGVIDGEYERDGVEVGELDVDVVAEVVAVSEIDRVGDDVVVKVLDAVTLSVDVGVLE